MIGTLQIAAAVLLVAAGVGKLRAPAAAAMMLRSSSPRAVGALVARRTVRLAGVIEIGVGTAVIVSGDRVCAALLAGCYLTFLLVAVRLQLTGRRDSCGCFGATDSPVGPAHLIVNVAAVGIAIAAVVRPPGSFGGVADVAALAGTVRVAQALVLAYLAFLSMTALPALAAARRRLLETA